MGFDDLERAPVGIIQDYYFIGYYLWNSRNERGHPHSSLQSLRAPDQRPIGMAMIGAFEERDLGPTGRRSSQAQSSHHCFGPGITERRALRAGQLRNQFRHLTRQARFRADLNPLLELAFEGFLDERRGMPEEIDTESHGDVDVPIAVDVPELRPL